MIFSATNCGIQTETAVYCGVSKLHRIEQQEGFNRCRLMKSQSPLTEGKFHWLITSEYALSGGHTTIVITVILLSIHQLIIVL